MPRLFFAFLLIFLVSQQAQSFDIFGIDFEDIKSVYGYVSKFYEKTEELRESPTLEVQNKGIALHEILGDLKGLSQQLTHIQNDEDVKLDTIVRVLLDNIDVSSDLQASKSDLIKYVNHIDYAYHKGIQYGSSPEFTNETLKGFASSVLKVENSIEETVAHLFSIIFPGPSSLLRQSFQSLSLSFAKANYERLCDKFISEQQRMYYIFMIIINTHLKAFATITQAYSIRFRFSGGRPHHEYGLMKQMFHIQLTDYFEEFTRIISDFPRDIRRCDVSRPKIGTNILEFEGLFQVVVNTEAEIRKKLNINPMSLNYASGKCEDIKSDREQFVVYNCKTVDSIKGCPVVNSNRILRFSWWQTATAVYGHPYECPVSVNKILGANAGWSYNDVCTCSLNYTDAPLRIYRFDQYHIQFERPKIMWVSVEPQMSDVRNNMIVVGVRFILHDNAIHLQIQQSELTHGSIPTDAVWKPVDVDNNNKKISIEYGNLFDRRNIMHLDDVGVDPAYVVTGVRLQLNKEGNGYELHVHGTQLLGEGHRLGASQMWYKPGDHPHNQDDYSRKRSEIHLNDPDDPSRIGDFHPDPEGNKFIQFRHSSINSDAGYHTVPFIDAQPVTVSTHSPLSGIGLFYRSRDGYGGYIAPRLFSLDHGDALRIAIKKWRQFDKIYHECNNDSSITQLDVNCTLFGPRPKVNAETDEDPVNIGLHTDSVINPTSYIYSNEPVETRSRDPPINHSNTIKPFVTSAGIDTHIIDRTRSDTNNIASIAVTQPTRNHFTTKFPSPNVGSPTIAAPTPPPPTNHNSVTPTRSLDSLSKNYTTNILPHSHHQNGPYTAPFPPTITYPPSSKSPNMTRQLIPTNGHSRVTKGRFINNAPRNRSHMYRRRLRRIERPLKVLRKDKSAVIYICETNIMSYEGYPPRSSSMIPVYSRYTDGDMSNSIPQVW